MPKVRVIRELAFKAPELRLDQRDKDRVAKLILGDVLNNIKTQRQADGTPIKPNAASTIRRKQAQGKPTWSLVDEKHRFTKPGNWIVGWTGEKTLVVEPGDLGGKPTLRELVDHLQQPVHGYTGWFGVSRAGYEAAQQLLKDFIRTAIRRRPR